MVLNTILRLTASVHLVKRWPGEDRWSALVPPTLEIPELSRNCEGPAGPKPEYPVLRQIGNLRGQGPVFGLQSTTTNPRQHSEGFLLSSRLMPPSFSQLNRWIRPLLPAALLVLAATTLAPAASGEGFQVGSLPARQAAATAALGWLHSLQGNDGKIGGLGESCDMTWVVAKAGENPDGPAWTPDATSLLDACAADVPTYLARRDTGRMAKVLRAAVAAGADARHFGGLDLIAELEVRYSPATGLYEPNFFYRHALAVTALSEAGRPIPPGVLPTLLAQQRPDGSWSWAVEADLSDGFQTPGDLDATGVTLQALRAAGLPLYHPAYAKGLSYIRSLQHADAGWGLLDGPTNSDSTALAIAGILAAGWDPESALFQRGGASPLSVLFGFQEASGAFVFRHGAEESRSMATYDAVGVLMQTYPGDVAKLLRMYLPVLAVGNQQTAVQ